MFNNGERMQGEAFQSRNREKYAEKKVSGKGVDQKRPRRKIKNPAKRENCQLN